MTIGLVKIGRLGLLVLVVAFQGCVSSVHHAGGGRPSSAPRALYRVQVQEGDSSLRGVVMAIEIRKDHPMSPVIHDLRNLKRAIADEVKARGGMVVDQPTPNALILRVNVSRYESREFRGMPIQTRQRTLLDFSSRIDQAEGRHLPDDGIRSLAGQASTPAAAHTQALRRFVAAVLLQPRVTAFIAEHRVSSEGLLALRLEQLAGDLFTMADAGFKAKQIDSPIRIALAPLRNDDHNRVGALLLPLLMQRFVSPDYRFFTRTQLANILEEQSLQMTDLVDQKTTVTAGGLQGVDYMVTGAVAQSPAGQTVQVEVLSVGSGEVLASAAVMARD